MPRKRQPRTEPRKKQVPPPGGSPASGRPLKATNEQKAALDRARSALRDLHEDIAAELKAQLSATKIVSLGGTQTVEVPDYGTRQGAIDRITARSGFLADPNEMPATVGSIFLDLVARPAGS